MQQSQVDGTSDGQRRVAPHGERRDGERYHEQGERHAAERGDDRTSFSLGIKLGKNIVLHADVLADPANVFIHCIVDPFEFDGGLLDWSFYPHILLYEARMENVSSRGQNIPPGTPKMPTLMSKVKHLVTKRSALV